MEKHLQKIVTEMPKIHHSIPAKVLPSDSEDLFPLYYKVVYISVTSMVKVCQQSPSWVSKFGANLGNGGREFQNNNV